MARTLERAWEEKLAAHQQLEEDYHRFLREQPRVLTAPEREAIRQLATDIPALWAAPTTTPADRKEIVRQVVERVEVDAQGKSEQVRVRMIWVGGGQTAGLVVRPIARYADRSDYAPLCARVRELTLGGWSAPAIAHQLDADGYPPVRGGRRWSVHSVLALRRHAGLGGQHHRGRSREALGPDEWWAPELARVLPVPRSCLFAWIQRTQVQARQEDRGLHRWIVWADAREVERLREYHRRDRAAETRQRWTATVRTEPTGS